LLVWYNASNTFIQQPLDLTWFILIHSCSFYFILLIHNAIKSPLGCPAWWILLVQRTHIQIYMFGHVCLQQGSCDSTNFAASGLVYFTSEYAVANMGVADIM
jgi:hypothetical protein